MTTPSEPASDARLQKHANLVAAALSGNQGDRSFRLWKESSVNDIAQLARRSERMELLEIDLSGDLNVVYQIQMPIPCWPREDELKIDVSAVFHLNYRDQWRTEPPAGWEPVGLLNPLDIFHPNSRPALKGALCLGRLPAGVAPVELILMAYFLGTLQDYTLDEQDPDGVLNPHACEWFRCHPQYLPLTHAGLFDSWSPEELEHVRGSQA